MTTLGLGICASCAMEETKGERGKTKKRDETNGDANGIAKASAWYGYVFTTGRRRTKQGKGEAEKRRKRDGET